MAFKHKIALSFSLLLILVVVAFWLSLKLQLQQTLAQQTDTLGQILARQTADSVTELVLADDVLGLNVVVNQLAREGGVADVTITDVDGRVLTSTNGRTGARDSKAYTAPVRLQEAIAGYVSLTLDETLVSNPVTRPDPLFFVIIAAGLVLVLATAQALAAQVTNPVLELVERLDDPDINPDSVQDGRRDEFGLLQQRVAELLWHVYDLEDRIEESGMPEQDPEDQGGLKAGRRMTTLVHVQVANTGAALDLLHPANLSTLLQQFQFYLRQAARLYRGAVMRINGDSALVAFDTARCQEEHAFDALCSAQLFVRLMRKVADVQRAHKAQALEFHVGICSGEAYFSPIWRKASHEEDTQRQESVIGPAVESAAELAAQCRAGEILVSDATFSLANGSSRFGPLQARTMSLDSGKSNLLIYELPPDAGSHSELLDRQCRHLLPDQA